MANTMGALATLVEKIRLNIDKASPKTQGENELDGSSLGNRMISKSTRKVSENLLRVSAAIHKMAGWTLGQRMEELNALDEGLIRGAMEKGYLTSSSRVVNNLQGEPTSMNFLYNGKSKVTIRNSYGAYISDFNTKPGEQHPLMKNDWARAFTLFHEMAHAEFFHIDKIFQPTPGLFIKDPEKEKEALDAINKWGGQCSRPGPKTRHRG